MLDPDSAGRVAPTDAGLAPGAAERGDAGPALQILTTEHWSLLASRSMGYTEAMSRTSIFVAALTGSVVALALVGQAPSSTKASSRSRSCSSRSCSSSAW